MTLEKSHKNKVRLFILRQLYESERTRNRLHLLASALRAAADHVVAEDALYARSCCEFVGSDCRSQLLAIADELGLNG